MEYNDIFSTPEAEIGEFPEFEMEIKLTNNHPIKCKPYKESEIDKQFMREQVEKWIKIGVCRNSSSPYGAPAFVVEQSHHESTPKRFVVDYSRTINSFTIKDPFRISLSTELVYRCTLRLQGEFISPSNTHEDHGTFVSKPQQWFRQIRPTPTSAHGQKRIFVFKDLKN